MQHSKDFPRTKQRKRIHRLVLEAPERDYQPPIFIPQIFDLMHEA